MIRLLRSADRLYVRNGAVEMWKTFDPDNALDPLHRGFRALESLREVRVPSGSRYTLDPDRDHEVVTYVRVGAFLARDGARGDVPLGPGCFQRASSTTSMTKRVSETATSRGAHLFVTSMRARPDEADDARDLKRFTLADRHGRLRLIAAPDGGDGLRLGQDVRLYSSLLDTGCHVVHDLPAGRRAWLQMVAGRIKLIDQSLKAGDGASFEDETAVSFTAQEASEVLLFELA